MDEYIDNVLLKTDWQDWINAPDLYHAAHHFNISLDDLLEAAETSPNAVQYDKGILRAMYLPYEDMLKAAMNAKGAYLNGNVYNIRTLNELFRTDREAFSRFRLAELIAYQERLEGIGIDYGFNQDMVDFANQKCR